MRKTLALLLAAGAIAASRGDAHAGTVKCGAILAAGKTYVLKHDLTCASGLGRDDDGTLRAALSVIDDATLDLNGHTLTCARRSKDRGVKVLRATIRNGTVRGCYTAVVAYSGVVQGMVFTDNRLGVAAMEASMIAGNTAVKNDQGFFEPEDGGSNTYLDNAAIDNDSGFASVGAAGSVYINNVAKRNRAGFGLSEGNARYIGNRSAHNEFDGFYFGYKTVVELTGNVAKGNGQNGFVFGEAGKFMASDNVANRNGRDGFMLWFDTEVSSGDARTVHYAE